MISVSVLRAPLEDELLLEEELLLEDELLEEELLLEELEELLEDELLLEEELLLELDDVFCIVSPPQAAKNTLIMTNTKI